jgi:hypothetical protein
MPLYQAFKLANETQADSTIFHSFLAQQQSRGAQSRLTTLDDVNRRSTDGPAPTTRYRHHAGTGYQPDSNHNIQEDL